jgi:Electron transfer flavoprotein, alpha subunit
MKALIFSDNYDMAKQIMGRAMQDSQFILMTTESNEDLLYFGAEKVIFLKGQPVYSCIGETLISEFKKGYDFILISSTTIGRDVAAYVSSKLNLDYIPEVFNYRFNGNKLITKRFSLGGKVVLEEESDAKILTVTPGVGEGIKSERKSLSEELKIPEGPIKVLAINPKQSQGVDIEKAEVIVSVGRGLGKKEGLALIEQLAKKVKGEIAGSRPVCLDYHWLSEERQVGYSGKKVRPKLYIAIGISGQIQHIAGMRDSKTVIAINKDKNAPIFQECDLGLVADLYKAVPKLIEML